MDAGELQELFERYGLTRIFDLVDARVRQKSDYNELKQVLDKIIISQRKKFIRNRFCDLRGRGMSYLDTIETIAAETGWSSSTVRKLVVVKPRKKRLD